MKPKVSIITLGVADFEQSLQFYRDGLKFPTKYKEGEGIAFFELEGTWLAVYPWEKLAEDFGADFVKPTGTPGFTLAHNVKSEHDVDAVIDFAVKVGATLVKKPPKKYFGVGILDISPIPMVTYGRWLTILSLTSLDTWYYLRIYFGYERDYYHQNR